MGSSSSPFIITPLYTQSPIVDNDGSSSSSLFAYAIFATLTFTVAVYLLETYLSFRQRSSYCKTDFPDELASTVGAIDAEDKKTEGNSTPTPTTAAASSDNSKEEASSLDKSLPLLPQLRSKFSSAQSYGLDKSSFSIVSETYALLEECVFLLSGFYPYIWDAACRCGSVRFGWSDGVDEIKITLLFLGIVTLVGTVTSLPFELYSTFRIEKKHGFNKQTIGLFVSDKLKGLALTVVIGGPFISLLLRIISWGGPRFYIYVWALTFFFSIFMLTIIPVYIMPLFNKYDPLEEGALKEGIYELAGRLEFPLTNLFVMDGSKRSSHSNAFMFGFHKNKR